MSEFLQESEDWIIEVHKRNKAERHSDDQQ